MLPSTDEALDLIVAPKNPAIVAAGLLSYAGLTIQDILKLEPEHARHTPPSLPGARESKGLSYEDARALLGAVDEARNLRDRCIIETAMVCGLRQVEMRRIKLKHIYKKDEAIYLKVIGKGGGRRFVYVPKMLVRQISSLLYDLEMEEHARPFNALFQAQDTREALGARGMRMVIDRYLKPINPDATAHSLRHTCVTWLLNSGASLDEAMEIVGHNEASSHEVYAAADDGWFIRSWQETHPMARWETRTSAGLGHVYVPGKERGRRMARGTERVVPILSELVDGLQDGIEALQGWDSQKVSTMFYRYSETSPTALREAAAASMAENGAHPFLLSLILGVTPGRAMEAKWDRRGEDADSDRRAAIERAVEPLYTYKDNEFDITGNVA